MKPNNTAEMIPVFLNDREQEIFNKVLEYYIIGKSDNKICLSVIQDMKLKAEEYGMIRSMLYIIHNSDYNSCRMEVVDNLNTADAEALDDILYSYATDLLINSDSESDDGKSEGDAEQSEDTLPDLKEILGSDYKEPGDDEEQEWEDDDFPGFDLDDDDEDEKCSVQPSSNDSGWLEDITEISLFADNNRELESFDYKSDPVRISLRDCYMHAKISMFAGCDDKVLVQPIRITVKNECNGGQASTYRNISSEKSEIFDINPVSLFPGNDYRSEQIISVTVYGDDEYEHIIKRRSFTVVYADTPLDLIKINRIGMFYASENVYSPFDVNCGQNYVNFLQSNLKNASLIIQYNVRADCKFTNVPIVAYLYDQMGRLLERVDADNRDDFLGSDHAMGFCFGGFCDRRWNAGRYRFEVVMLGRTVATANFVVGNTEMEGEIDINQMISMIRTNVNGGGEVKDINAAEQLDTLIGLKKVKAKIASLSRMSNLAVLREQQGLPATNSFLHATFVGSPGTGKTTIANIVGQIYKGYGLLSKGHVVCVDRKSLIGRYYDSELRAIEQAVDNAQGGVLFVDEAYSLYVEDDPKDPGHKVIEGLLTALSDPNRKDWMLVLAGYPDKMDNFLNANPGLRSRIPHQFVFEDYNVDELMQIAELYCREHFYIMDDAVRTHLRSVVTRDYASRNEKFGNARYVIPLLENTVVANMAQRLSGIENPTARQLQKIEVEDIPSMRTYSESRAMSALNEMIGLENIKTSIATHLNFVKMTNLRIRKGMHTTMPPLHMIFTGNPGTGKTTVADFMGEIYASMGILSQGDVIRVEKADLVGSRIGETESKTKAVLSRAKGNILFIDEAYQLAPRNGAGEEGRLVVDTLLTALSNDNLDTIVILAGYPEDMQAMLNMNEGLRSRFPYTFHFEDYSVDELVNIAIRKAAADEFVFSKAALVKLRALIKSEVMRKKSTFGNARFVTRLISTRILPNMATRLNNMKEEPTRRQLRNIVAEDIPISDAEAKRIETGGFDEQAIDQALVRLDALVGIEKVKKAVHNFVTVARYRNAQGERFVGKGLLKWNFVGNTGTGKSTVAEILADILRAMNVLDKGNIVEVRGEQIYHSYPSECDAVLRDAMERSRYGMLFIDGDAPEFRTEGFRMTNEQLRIRLSSLTAETGGPGALVIAECSSPRQTMAGSLAHNGVYDFDHIFVFDDYTSSELFDIVCHCLAKHKVRFSSDAEAKMRAYIDDLCSNRDLSFANARTMKLLSRTIYDKMILRQSKCSSRPANVVQLEDVESYVWHKPYSTIGY